MIVAYTLTMPNIGSWNGKWNVSDGLYVRCRKYKKDNSRILIALKSKSFYYDFGDGWGASVKLKEVDAKEAAWLRKKSNGFSQYDWMIDEIEEHGRILDRKERRIKAETNAAIRL